MVAWRVLRPGRSPHYRRCIDTDALSATRSGSNIQPDQDKRVKVDSRTRALASRSPVILADEPTAPLDGARDLAIMRILHRERKRNERRLPVNPHDRGRLWSARWGRFGRP